MLNFGLGVQFPLNPNPWLGGSGEGVKNSQRRKEGEKKCAGNCACPLGLRLEPGTYRVLGESQ